jgi:hypothetical protein
MIEIDANIPIYDMDRIQISISGEDEWLTPNGKGGNGCERESK